MSTPKHFQIYVCGFLFNSLGFVALIHKLRGPKEVVGKLNGVGGKVEADETPLEAMRREFKEEAGLDIRSWFEFCVLDGPGWRVHFFYDKVLDGGYDLRSMTDEPVHWHPIENINLLPVVNNLKWLIPMALDPRPLRAKVKE